MATDHVYEEQDYFYRYLTEPSEVRLRIAFIWARDQGNRSVPLSCCAALVSRQFAHMIARFSVSCRSLGNSLISWISRVLYSSIGSFHQAKPMRLFRLAKRG